MTCEPPVVTLGEWPPVYRILPRPRTFCSHLTSQLQLHITAWHWNQIVATPRASPLFTVDMVSKWFDIPKVDWQRLRPQTLLTPCCRAWSPAVGCRFIWAPPQPAPSSARKSLSIAAPSVSPVDTIPSMRDVGGTKLPFLRDRHQSQASKAQ
jgi:hypothetical protein